MMRVRYTVVAPYRPPCDRPRDEQIENFARARAQCDGCERRCSFCKTVCNHVAGHDTREGSVCMCATHAVDHWIAHGIAPCYDGCPCDGKEPMPASTGPKTRGRRA